MKTCVKLTIVALAVLLASQALYAAEIITRPVVIRGVTVQEEYFKLVDNWIVLVDSSGSMAEKYLNTDMTRFEALRTILKQRNDYIPELGYTAALCTYTPWKSY